MYKFAIHRLCAIVLLVWAASASATFHLWQIREIYSNADGTIQFVELATSAGGQEFVDGQTLRSSQGATTHSFVFPSDLPSDSAGRSFLIGTDGFAALGLVTPDYVVPDGFLFTTNGSVDFAGVDSVSWAALPVDGIMSINRSGATAINSPRNFAGATGSVHAAAATPACTLTATPASIASGGTSTLAASCSPAATAYAWSANTGFGSAVTGGTVSPTATTTYAVTGSNASGMGNTATATVTVTAGTQDDLIVYLEEPINAGTASGVSNIRGWAVSRRPIQRIDLYIDGTLTYTLPYGGSRPDVGVAFPAYPGSANSGFSMAYAYGVLSAGSHTFLARAVDDAGNVRDSVATFTVVRLPSSFISNPAEVILLGGSTIIVDGNTLRMANVRVQGVNYTLTLRWNTATQGFELVAAEPH